MASKSSGSSGGRSRSGSSGPGSRNRSKSSRQSSNGGSPNRSSASTAKADEQAQGAGGTQEPDVLLDVPQLKVDEIGLEVDNLHARIALETTLGEMLKLYVGADVVVDKVALEIKGVEAQAQLKARLHNVFSILDRTLQTVDQKPELLTELATAAGETTGDASGSARGALESGDGDE